MCIRKHIVLIMIHSGSGIKKVKIVHNHKYKYVVEKNNF